MSEIECADVRQNLLAAGLKITSARVEVLKVFHQPGERHLRAEDVYRLLNEARKEIPLGTVYRALAQLVEVGCLSNHSLGNNAATVYELNEGTHHDHIVCLGCGNVAEFCDPLIRARELRAAENLGYIYEHHQLVLFGYCQHCRPLARASS